MPTQPTPIAPVYRYFTTDLLTNRILAEIPLRDVTFECAVTAAGKFSGKIPVIRETIHQDLYDSLMPGNTGLYVVRNGKCVWGGIIWARDYDVDSKNLKVSASEFTSYFYHRKIWKTWNHQFGASVSYSTDAGWRVLFDSGSNVTVKGGSTVKMEFYEQSNWKYNGMYRVSPAPAPSTDRFSMVGGFAVADVVSLERINGWLYVYTKENHGYNAGDVITMTLTSEGGIPYTPTTVEYVIDSTPGPDTNLFRVPTTPGLTLARTTAEGTTARALPKGTYNKVTVTVHMDTFDYIRTLIDSMFEDFVGVDFPNVYIEPGISYDYNIISKQIVDGYAIIETDEPHGVSPGQAVQVVDVDNVLDGEFEVTDIPTPTTLVYESGGVMALTAVAPISVIVSTVLMNLGRATLTTTTAHGFKVGQTVRVTMGEPFGVFDGTFTVARVPSTTTFEYQTEHMTTTVASTSISTATTIVAGDPLNEVARASVTADVVTLELKNPVVFSPGDSVLVSNVNRNLEIVEATLTAATNQGAIRTAEPHGLKIGDSVNVRGVVENAALIAKSTTGTVVTMTTLNPHNLRIGESVSLSGTEELVVTNKALTSNVVTLTTSVPHNLGVGATINVSGIKARTSIASRVLSNNVATITTTAAHNYQVNDKVSVVGLDDRYSPSYVRATKGLVTLILPLPHNVQVGNKIHVSGLGAPYDTNEVTVDARTPYTVTYKIDQRYWEEKQSDAARAGSSLAVPYTTAVTPAKPGGHFHDIDSIFNGLQTLTAASGSTFSYYLGGENMAAAGPTTSGEGSPYNEADSILNGEYTTTAVTATTVSYAKVANNIASTPVPTVASNEVVPVVQVTSVHAGVRVITGVTATSFTFAQTTASASSQTINMSLRKASIFNNAHVVTSVPQPDKFTMTMTGFTANATESVEGMSYIASATSLYNGTYTITAVDTVRNSISYARVMPDYPSKYINSRGVAAVKPTLIVSTFGPFPGSADIDFNYSDRAYTGINIEPTPYRGFELKSVGEALDSYSDNLRGFEYRIDCDYDEENNEFTRTVVLIPINFPNPPAPGEVAPLSRYNADKLVFEYPGGNIINASFTESAENSATRFFAVGTTDLGPDAGPDIGIASSLELLRGDTGRAWPLLDASETIDGVEDEETLYAYAERYLSEAAPPYTTLSVSVNGSLAPFVGDYRAGDWCSLLIDDDFVRMRLASDLEPRNDVLVRKISSYTVKVPPSITFPETVTLNLVSEWEVDKRG